MQKATEAVVNSLYPAKKYMLTFPCWIALGVTIFTAAFVSISYIPCVTSTIMQLRCGVIPTLHSIDRDRYTAGHLILLQP